MPHGRRLGHVNVVCVIVIMDGKERKKRGNRDWIRDPKVGQLTLSLGPARAWVCNYCTYKDPQVKGLFLHWP